MWASKTFKYMLAVTIREWIQTFKNDQNTYISSLLDLVLFLLLSVLNSGTLIFHTVSSCVVFLFGSGSRIEMVYISLQLKKNY